MDMETTISTALMLGVGLLGVKQTIRTILLEFLLFLSMAHVMWATEEAERTAIKYGKQDSDP